jgi:hypothetical protein
MLALLAFRAHFFGLFPLARAAAADLALLTSRAGMAPVRLFSPRVESRWIEFAPSLF